MRFFSYTFILAIAAVSLVTSIKADSKQDGKLWAACSSKQGEDDVAAVKKAIEKGANVNHQDEASGQTPLMGAVLRGKVNIVRHLLDIQADVTIGEKQGYTPAHGAAFQGRPGVMQMLIDHGIDVNVPHSGDGHVPLIRTCWGGKKSHYETFKVLLNTGIDIFEGGKSSIAESCMEKIDNDEIKQHLMEAMSTLDL
eukprot:CAMPEP_0198250620 /NCGR_PEP_ID=MMETSP1447-20131203/1729_1 /TAXON_ID=420782 /ORGANISM="Chaetoceros dichaeta, Strain CCMP1751" /LENGTH=195 /DNA_ID=CAMNT_0043935467 /DNA_START=25 /DNA_END=612 /DNA_ORIENTATION=+